MAVKVKSEVLVEAPAFSCHLWLFVYWSVASFTALLQRVGHWTTLSWMQRAMWARAAAVCQSVERQKVDTTANAKQSAASDRLTDRLIAACLTCVVRTNRSRLSPRFVYSLSSPLMKPRWRTPVQFKLAVRTFVLYSQTHLHLMRWKQSDRDYQSCISVGVFPCYSRVLPI